VKKVFPILIAVVSLFTIASSAQAKASLYLSPSSGTYTVGNSFLIQLMVNSGDQAINATDGTLIFDPNKLEVVSISKTGSVLSLWVQDPTFSNVNGLINFAGGKPSPGYSGAAGSIIYINFKAKTAGTVNVTFASGSVLADDGKGTNVLANMGSGSYTLAFKELTPIPVPPPEGVPLVPIVVSPTHPDENKWYSNNNPEFTWKLPYDIIGVSLLTTDKPTSNPGTQSDGLTESKKFEQMAEGVSYFHIRYQNKYGWGEILHRKILIDTLPPLDFEVTFNNQGDPTNPQPYLIFGTTDEGSGVEYYEVKTDQSFPSRRINVEDLKQNLYQLPVLAPGKHISEIKAFDRAGNYTAKTINYSIQSIETPKITYIPDFVRIGEALRIEGEAKPETMIRIYIHKIDGETVLEKIQSNSSGKFSLTYGKFLERGNYLVWAQAEDPRGALSEPTVTYALEVGLPPFLQFGKLVLDYLSTIVTLLVLLIAIILMIVYTWYRISMWRRRVSKQTKEAASRVTRAFEALRQETEKQVAMLDKKPGLTKAERELRDKLRNALNICERFISKKIKDIEEELK